MERKKIRSSEDQKVRKREREKRKRKKMWDGKGKDDARCEMRDNCKNTGLRTEKMRTE